MVPASTPSHRDPTPCTDLLAEGAISLSAAARDHARANPSTVWRWCRKGIRGVRLQYARLGRKIVTSRQAIARFATELAALDETVPDSQPQKLHPGADRTPDARSAAAEAADRRLSAAGI